jgi:hypothetical protein
LSYTYALLNCYRTSISSEINDKNQLDPTASKQSTTLPIQQVDEPKKTINCKYFGSIQVLKPHGMDELNDAIWKIYNKLVTKNVKEEDEVNNDSDDNGPNYDDDREEEEEDEDDFVKNKIKQKLKNIQVTVSPSSILAELLLSNNVS